jgi:hypothetical protein
MLLDDIFEKPESSRSNLYTSPAAVILPHGIRADTENPSQLVRSKGASKFCFQGHVRPDPSSKMIWAGIWHKTKPNVDWV